MEAVADLGVLTGVTVEVPADTGQDGEHYEGTNELHNLGHAEVSTGHTAFPLPPIVSVASHLT
ncbi:hypothetical protein GCM10027610_009790 [Dactylosporangium cerinum]